MATRSARFRKFLIHGLLLTEVEMHPWPWQALWKLAMDMAAVLGLPFIGLLLFIWHKHRERKQMIIAVIRYGLWRGSGERIEG